MKKTFNLCLWFCTATLLAQFFIVGLAFLRGNVHRSTLVQIVALLNGIDIQGQRLKSALVSTQSVSTPNFEEVLTARAKANIEFENRENALNRRVADLDAREARQAFKEDALDKRHRDFEERLDGLGKKANDEGLQKLQRAIEVLAPELAKNQLLTMMDSGSLKDVVAIVNGIDADKRKKILGEFAQAADAAKLAELLSEMRKGEPLSSLIDDAKASENTAKP